MRVEFYMVGGRSTHWGVALGNYAGRRPEYCVDGSDKKINVGVITRRGFDFKCYASFFMGRK